MPDRSRLDIADIAAAESARNESDFTIPAEVMDAMLTGKAPVAAWREYRGMTLAALSVKAGLNRSHLSRIAKGRTKPQPATIARLAAALAVPEWAMTIDQ